MGDAAVSTAGPVGRPEGPTSVASLRPYRPWIGGAGRHGGRQARVRSHRPWSGAAREAWPQAVTRAGADEGSEAEGSFHRFLSVAHRGMSHASERPLSVVTPNPYYYFRGARLAPVA